MSRDTERAELPELPEPARTAYVEGPASQGGEYRMLCDSYEPDCAMYSPNQMREYARAILAAVQPPAASQPAPGTASDAVLEAMREIIPYDAWIAMDYKHLRALYAAAQAPAASQPTALSGEGVNERNAFEDWWGAPPIEPKNKKGNEIAFWCWQAWSARALAAVQGKK